MLILTDSVSAGFVIRNFITSIVPNEYITNAYIPDIFGKEKRKESASKEGKLGVEGVSSEVIVKALENVGVGCVYTENKDRKTVTNIDLYDDGLNGTADSKINRLKLLKYLDLPQRLSTKGLVEIINTLMTYDEYKFAVEKSREVEL